MSSIQPHQNGDYINERYLVKKMLGRGAAGYVYLVLDSRNASIFAIKQVSGLKEEMKAMKREIALLKNLRHENIVKYQGSFETDRGLYIVLDFVEGGSLSDLVKQSSGLPERVIAIYINQALEGLIYLLEQGVVHRDIKGANILTDKKGIVKLADFGIAMNVKKGDNRIVGSPYWMAPEIIELNGATHKADIWSLGCTIIELLTGKPPYYDLDKTQAIFKIVQDDIPLPDSISPPLKEFLGSCFQREPSIRADAKILKKKKWLKNITEIIPDESNINEDEQQMDKVKSYIQQFLLQRKEIIQKFEQKTEPGDNKPLNLETFKEQDSGEEKENGKNPSKKTL